MSNAVRDLTTALEQKYVIEREVGRGAMARVFLARELQHNRSVALKVLDPELTNSVAAARFNLEVKTAAKLTHPNILPIHDSGSAANLLYYVTPYVSGQTLRACMDKEGTLPLADALAIAQQIADALGYAHEQGVVHRDIKPENILLTSGRQVWVADFGLAHALTSGMDARLTATGMSIGSPLYMSPEQASGSSRIDGRADIYALGCVLYEMLTGAVPFTGSDIPTVLAQHLTATPTHASRINKHVPPHVDAAICKALEKAPHKRFNNAREFRDALLPAAASWGAKRKVAVGAGLLSTVTIIMLLLQGPREGGALAGLPWPGRTSPDTARYVVLPFEGASESGVEAQQRMHDALRRWTGIEVVDLIRVQEEVRPDSSSVRAAKARRVARGLGAGRFIRGSVTRMDGRYRVTAAVYDSNERNRTIDQVTLVHAGAGMPLDSLYAAVADSLLFGPDGSGGRTPAPRGTTSRPARESYLQGQRALLDWEIARADSLFMAATRYDPGYAQAHLWLAEVRSWLYESPAQWQLQAERAVAGKAALTPRERSLSEALHALATSRYQQACAIYDSLAATDPRDFFFVYGTADCRRRDRVVVRDPSSESGWRFRSNYHRAIIGYRRAFQLLPATHKAFRANSFARVQDLIFTRTSQVTSGHADSLRFLAPAIFRGDSVVFIPYTTQQFAASSARTTPEAVQWLRGVYYDIARNWSSEYSGSSAATEALALATDLRGDPAASTLIRRARAQATSPRERAHLGALQLIIELKRALPRDLAGIRAAAALADSLVQQNSAEANWSSFAPAVGLIAGRPDYAARAARASVSGTDGLAGLPIDMWSDAQALLAYAAIGVRTDSIRELDQRVRERIARLSSRADMAYELTLIRPAFMAFPFVHLPTLTSEYVAGDPLIEGQNSFARRDFAGARQAILGKMETPTRKKKNPADLQFDVLYPEAWLLHAAGSSDKAAALLDPTLRVLSEQDPAGLADFPRTAALLRAIELRARIAHALGDQKAASLWANALLILWDKPDPVLQSVVNGLRPYVNSRKR